MVSSTMRLKAKHYQPFTAARTMSTLQSPGLQSVLKRQNLPVVHASALPPSNNGNSKNSNNREPQAHDAPKQPPFTSRLRRLGMKRPEGRPPPPPPGPFRPSQVQQLAGHAAYTGFVGTLAVVAANALGIDLWASDLWQWTNVHDLQLAVIMVSPLLVANLVLLGPDWADWKLPDLSAEEIAAERAASKQQQEAAQPSRSADRQLASATGSSSSRGGQSTANMQVPASVWGMLTQQATQLPPSWRMFRDAANLAQGNYVANNPTAGINPVAELGVAAVDSLTSEMLFRGILITIVAAWLRDRLYEAGWSDMVSVPPFVASLITGLRADGGEQLFVDSTQAMSDVASAVPLDDVARWGAGACLLLMLSGLAARRVGRAAKKMAVMNDITDRIKTVREQQRKQRAKEAASASVKATVGDGSVNSSTAQTAQTPSGSDSTAQEAQSSSQSFSDDGQPAQASSPAAAAQDSVTSTSDSQRPTFGVPLQGMAGSSLPDRKPPSSSSHLPQAADAETSSTANSTQPPPSTSSEQPQPHAPGATQPLATSTPTNEKPGAASGPMKGGPRPAFDSMKGGPASDTAEAGPKLLPQVLTVSMAGDQLISASAPAQSDPSSAFNAVVWSTALQASRDLLQSGTLSMLFVATGGNLAACFLASLVNQAVFSALQRLGRERTRKRSAIIAQELADFNAKLQAIANKKRQQKAAAAAEQQAAASSAAAQPNTSEAGIKAPGQDSVLAAFATAKTEAAAKPVVTLEEVQARTGMARTVGMLDLLVPEPPPAKQPHQTVSQGRGKQEGGTSAKQQE